MLKRMKFKIDIYRKLKYTPRHVLPFWFQLFARLFISMEELENYREFGEGYLDEKKKIRRILAKKVYMMDFTFPLPPYLEKKRRSKMFRIDFLLEFYNRMKLDRQLGVNEVTFLNNFIGMGIASPYQLKIIHEIKKRLMSEHKTFFELLKEYERMFGVEWVNTLKAVEGSGNIPEILPHIIESAKIARRNNKSLQSVKRSLALTAVMAFGLLYMSIGWFLPISIEIIPYQSRTWDLELLLRLGNWMMEGKTLIGLGVLVVLGVTIPKVLNINQAWIDYLILLNGKMKKVIFTLSASQFLNTLTLQVQYMQNNEYQKMKDSIDPVSNAYIKGYFRKMIEKVTEENSGYAGFFRENGVFPEVVIKTFQKTDSLYIEDEIGRMSKIVEEDSEELQKTLPVIIESVNMLITTGVIVLTTVLYARVEIILIQGGL